MRALVVAALLVMDCAARTNDVPQASPGPTADARLGDLESAFRARDCELGDALAQPARPDCLGLEPLQGEVGRLMAAICTMSVTAEGGRVQPGASCRYARERTARLRREAKLRGCEQRGHIYPMLKG